MIDSAVALCWVGVQGLLAFGIGRLALLAFGQPRWTTVAERMVCQVAAGLATLGFLGIVVWGIGPSGRWLIFAASLAGAFLGVVSLTELTTFRPRWPRRLTPLEIFRHVVRPSACITPAEKCFPPKEPSRRTKQLRLRRVGPKGLSGLLPRPQKRESVNPPAEDPRSFGPGGQFNWTIQAANFLGMVFAIVALVCAPAPTVDSRAVEHYLAKIHAWHSGQNFWVQMVNGLTPLPGVADGLFLCGYTLAGTVGPNLLQWWLGIVFAWAAGELVAALAGWKTAALARAIVLAFPAVNRQMFTPLPELATGCWCTLAALTLRKSSAEKDRSWLPFFAFFALAGCFSHPLGAAYLAIVLVANYLATSDSFTEADSLRRVYRFAVRVAAIGAVAALGWFWWPAFVGPFGPLSVAEYETDKLPVRLRGWELFTLVLPGTGPLHETPPNSCCTYRCDWSLPVVVDELGLAVPAMLPAIFWYGVLPPKRLVLIGGGFLAIFVITTNFGADYVLPVVLLLVAGIAWVWQNRTGRYPLVDAGVDLLALFLVATQIFWPAKELAERLPVVLGTESSAQYLARRDPAGPIAEILTIWPAKQVKVLSTAPNAYLPGEIVDERAFRKSTTYDDRIRTTEELLALLRGNGITHILLAEPLTPGDRPELPLKKILRTNTSPESEASIIRLADLIRKHHCGHRWRYELFYIEPNRADEPDN
ncbi:MAG: hypothetical protein NZ899_10205 [Thermoguttaceae bacterium]|nr:hypothetical protein [Thermoguttaceae bacterium]MDW8078058.1 hypothetical protein [Thermoguttaceae bacterium]